MYISSSVLTKYLKKIEKYVIYTEQINGLAGPAEYLKNCKIFAFG